MEFLRVDFDGGDCGVIIDGVIGAWRTNRVLQLDAGHHLVSLSLPASTFTPPETMILLAATTVLNPQVVAFTKIGPKLN